MKAKIKVTYSASWTETITVEIPDGATEDQADEKIDAAIDAFEPSVDPADIDVEEWSYAGEKPTYAPEPPPQYGEPAPESWIVVGDHRWLTDAACMLREDAPRPVCAYKMRAYSYVGGWLVPRPDERAYAINLIAASPNGPLSTSARVHRRFAPILAACDRWSSGGTAGVFYGFRGGELVAVIGQIASDNPDAVPLVAP